ncbi:hypothetical protein NLJ89_g11490 [Agrocybe chaxingu]|uniref:non-specific serine/threonine protein kinase n=1 Tax=Agrocybe chaxingu TaxID=84603 RepID=A0A9W8JP35_9AGAR|nr:hypothetical protein NLJ89_g11490 [Agrocybe chaxingu]
MESATATVEKNPNALSPKDVEYLQKHKLERMTGELRPAPSDTTLAFSCSGERPRRLRAVILHGQSDHQRAKAVDHLRDKISKWARCTHRSLIAVVGLYIDIGDVPVLRLVSDGPELSVLEHLLHLPKEDTDAYRVQACKDIAAGIDYLHARSLVHGAIRASNILVKEGGACCLGEFSSEDVPSQHTLTTYASWMAPEIASYKSFHNLVVDHYRREGYYGEYRTDSDMFAFGCTMYELYMGRPPPPIRIPYHKVKDFYGLTRLYRAATEEEHKSIPPRMLKDIMLLLGRRGGTPVRAKDDARKLARSLSQTKIQ